MLQKQQFRFVLLLSTLIALTPLLGSQRLRADGFDIQQIQKQVYQLIESVKPASVSIGTRGAAFSGVIVSSQGHVLSAGHTVNPGQRYRIRLHDGRVLQGTGLGSSRRLDCGLIKINDASDLPFAEMGDSSQLAVNQPCVGLSFPGGLTSYDTPVVRFGRVLRISGNRLRMIQSTSLMEPGDSGGPLFDLNGKVIGIHSRIGESTKQNFEVPINIYKKHWSYLNRAERFGDPDRDPPRIGFQSEETGSNNGLRIRRVYPDSTAEKSGLQTDDLIKRIGSADIRDMEDLNRIIRREFSKKTATLTFAVEREGKIEELEIPFISATRPDDVELPAYSKFEPSIAYEELSNLPQQFSELESRLDDLCVLVESDFGKRKLNVVATRLKNRRELLSKSSRVGSSPFLIDDGKRIALEVVARDATNDLVLLRAPEPNAAGIALDAAPPKVKLGTFLLSPDPQGAGLISVKSSGEFSSRRVDSKGFLGVRPFDHPQGAGVEVMDGAAQQAGMESGDVVFQINDTEIKSAKELFDFMRTTDPNETIVARVRRDDQELELEIMLGGNPGLTGHAADLIEKSGRRDGFSRVFSHDANLEPEDCGGPVFDMQGSLVGINIARNSRVRSYTIPLETVREFVNNYLR